MADQADIPGTNSEYFSLWQAVLEDRLDDSTALCRMVERTGSRAGSVISVLVQGMCASSDLMELLSGFGRDEESAAGWQAFFFGMARQVVGQGLSALKLFWRASESKPCRVPALVYLAGLHMARNEWEKARETVQEGMALSDEVGEFHILNAHLLLQNEKEDQALEQVATAKITGCYAPLSMVRFELELLLARGGHEKAKAAAEELLSKGLGRTPKELVAAVGLGVFVACGALDEADNYLDQALEKDRRNLALLTHRADIATLRGRFRVAAVAIQQALAGDENNIALLHRKACLAGQGITHEQGIEVLNKLTGLTRDYPASNRALFMAQYGDIHFEQEKSDEAEKAFREALAVDGKCIQALCGLAQVLTSLGRLDEAREIQDRVNHIAPIRAMQMMINADRIPEGDHEVRRMKQMAEAPHVPLQIRASLNFSLAGVWQKRQEHEKAIAYADKANEITRIFLSFDHEQEARNVDRIIARMSKAFFENRVGFGSDCELPVFLLGMPRSGTTLVEQIVGGHSRVSPGGELSMIPTMWRRLSAWEHRMGSSFRNIPGCVMELTRDQSLKFAHKIEEEYRELMPSHGGLVHITDKLPHNFKNIGLIKLLFPKARIVYCRRNPGGIALSNYFTDYKARYGGMGFAYDKTWIGSEIANCRRLMDHWMELFGNRIHIIDYEELVESPRSTVESLLDYLELPWEDQVMDFPTLKRPVRTASVIQVRKPIYTGAVSRWKNYRDSLRPVFDALDARKRQDMPTPILMPAHEPGLFLNVMDLLQQGRFKDAEEGFKEILDTYPRHAAAMHMLGAAYSHQGKLLPAHKCMKRSIRFHPGNPTWYANLAVILDHMQRPDEAEKIREQGRCIASAQGTDYLPERDMTAEDTGSDSRLPASAI